MTSGYACGRDVPWGYDEAVAALRSALKFGVNPSLDGIVALCEALGRPQDAMAIVQVAGTNGKTSTARFTAALLQAQGLKTALYTSPELERYPERIEVDGSVIDDAGFARAVGAAVDTASALHASHHGDPGPVTEFELLTAAALWHFRECGVEIAVLEVGMGGRWDATSVAAPSVAVITGVGLDHTHILGDTIEQIAAEKAAIVRPGSSAVLGPSTAVVESIFVSRAEHVGTHPWAVREAGEPSPVAEELTVRYSVKHRPDALGDMLAMDVSGVHASYESLRCALPAYQAPNVATAIAAAEAALGRALDPESVGVALRDVRVPGRFEVVSAEPLLVVDAAHNPQAAAVLAATVADVWPQPSNRPTLVLGILADKDSRGIVEALAPLFERIVVTASRSPRSMAPEALSDVVAAVTGRVPQTENSVAEAIDALFAHGRSILATGSITVAGEARTYVAAR